MSKKKPVAQPSQRGLVIDSSVAIAWCFPDEQAAYSQSVYDAAYLELAMRRGVPLATLDDKLKAAAEAVGVPLYGLHRSDGGKVSG